MVGFADGYPLLITSTASIDAVNTQLELSGKGPVNSARFRPNIVLGGEGIEPFVEDKIEAIEFDSHGLIWRFIRSKPCGRCVVVDKDPDTGDTSPGVQKALSALGRTGTYTEIRFGSDPKIFFGQNFVIQVPEEAHYDQPAIPNRGSLVKVKYTDRPNWIPVGGSQ